MKNLSKNLKHVAMIIACFAVCMMLAMTGCKKDDKIPKIEPDLGIGFVNLGTSGHYIFDWGTWAASSYPDGYKAYLEFRCLECDNAGKYAVIFEFRNLKTPPKNCTLMVYATVYSPDGKFYVTLEKSLIKFEADYAGSELEPLVEPDDFNAKGTLYGQDSDGAFTIPYSFSFRWNGPINDLGVVGK